MATLLPPPQYDVPPPMPVIELVFGIDDVRRVCSMYMGRPGNFRGCSFKKDGKCYVFRIGSPEVERHERAHCAGWPADHPGGWWDMRTKER